MDRLPAFDALRSEDAVAFAESTARHDPEEFGYWRGVDGMLILGVPDEAGDALLMDSTHGWRLPYAAVDDGDWTGVACESAEALTGVEATVERVERVERVEHRTENGDDRTNDDPPSDDRRTVTHDVLIRTTPVPEGSLAVDPRLPDWGRLTVDWFGEVPEDAYRDHPETIADIERILD